MLKIINFNDVLETKIYRDILNMIVMCFNVFMSF